MSQIFFHYSERKYKINRTSRIKASIIKLFKKENIILGRVDYIFCSDEYLLNLNEKFLFHNTFTDVITFPSHEESQTSGEVYISMDRIKENAKKFKVLIDQELLRVIFHGALHLCGEDDIKPTHKKRMRSKEKFYLQKFNLCVSY